MPHSSRHARRGPAPGLDTRPGDTGAACESAAASCGFRLDILAEVQRELAAAPGWPQFLDVFLLSAMGAVGAATGFLTLKTREAGADGVMSAVRGMTAPGLEAMAACFKPAPAVTMGTGARVHLIMRGPPGNDLRVPARTRLVLGFQVPPRPGDEDAAPCGGLLGLGEPLRGGAYSAEEECFLSHLLDVFLQAMETRQAMARVQALNASMVAANKSLSAALQQAAEARKALDRRLLHLHALHDAALDFAACRTCEELRRAFALLAMGGLRATAAGVLLLDRTAGTADWSCAGLEAAQTCAGRSLDLRDAEAMVYAALSACGFEGFQHGAFLPVSVLPRELDAAWPFPPHLAAVFRVDDRHLGLALLAAPLPASPDEDAQQGALIHEDAGSVNGDGESDLFADLGRLFLVYFKNVSSMETITALNQDLAARNDALARTLEELTSSRSRVAALEQAFAEVRTRLLGHARRLASATGVDVAAILLVGALLGLLFNMANPYGVDLVPAAFHPPHPAVLEATAARAMLAEGEALLIDARLPELHKQNPPAGAVNLPPTLFDFLYAMHLGRRDLDAPVLVTGRTVSRHYDVEIAQRLMARGHARVYVVQGALPVAAP
ncbi:MAG: rhodanese-like domain-containing protein [Desulfovibrio sp.]|nr:rhodanese-like domain-containing protein [Desulfovibrio sp.]